MNRPWMPLYIADYLADTAHLNAAQSGAYLHLIMHYWQTGSLPDDDGALARIARMGVVEWKKNRGMIEAFFHDGWRHKRIDAELAHAQHVSSKRRASAEQRHNKSSAIAAANGHANAEQLDTHAGTRPPASPSQPQSQPERKQDEDDALRASPPSNGKYAFESGVIRLIERDLERWRKAFPNLSLEAELIGLSAWAEQQSNWFNAVSGALAKKQREALLAIERVRAEAVSKDRPLRNDEWDPGL